MVFTIIEDSVIVLRKGGVYRQEKVYRRGECLYAKYGSGYVRLFLKGATSVPKLGYDEIILPEGLLPNVDGHGRLKVSLHALKLVGN